MSKIKRAIKKWTKFDWERLDGGSSSGSGMSIAKDQGWEDGPELPDRKRELTPLEKRNREAAGWNEGEGYGGGYGGYGGGLESDYEPGPVRYKSGSSYSSRWTTRWENWTYGSSFITDPNEALLVSYLNKLARTANVVLTAEEQEQPMLLRWASKNSLANPNDPNRNVITLSPDILLQSEETERDMLLDGLIGQVLMLTGMKRTALAGWDAKCAAGYAKWLPANAAIGQLWTALEMVAARTNIISDWPGFLPYFIRQSDMMGVKKEVITAAIARIGETDALPNQPGYVCAMLVIWNILNPQDSITPPPSVAGLYERVMTEATNKNVDRFTAAFKAISSLNPTDMGFEFANRDVLVDTTLLYQPAISVENANEKLLQLDITGYSGRFVSNSDGTPSAQVPILITRFENTDPTTYLKVAAEVAPVSRRIASTLRFRSQRPTLIERGLARGDLDDGSLDKLVTEQHPRVWESRRMAAAQDVAFGLLMDESGSMGHCIGQALAVCVAIVEALRSVNGVHVMVLGHSANGPMRWRDGAKLTDYATTKTHAIQSAKTMRRTPITNMETVYDVRINEYFTKNHKQPYGIVFATSGGNNLDGYAMEYAARKMEMDYPDCRRVLFVVSDGQPSGAIISNGERYGGDPAMQHMRDVGDFARSTLGVQVFGLGIANAYPPTAGQMMYGDGRFVILSDVLSSAIVLGAFMNQVCKKL